MPIGYIVQVENDCWVFGVIEYKKYAFQAWKPADFLNCFLCALRHNMMRGMKQQMREHIIQGDFFQVGESIKASNSSYDIPGWTKISL